jgi:hypothetical protein
MVTEVRGSVPDASPCSGQSGSRGPLPEDQASTSGAPWLPPGPWSNLLLPSLTREGGSESMCWVWCAMPGSPTPSLLLLLLLMRAAAPLTGAMACAATCCCPCCC